MSKKEIVLIVFILFLVCAVLYYLYFLTPTLETIDETKLAIEQKEVKIVSMQTAIAQIDDIKSQIAQLEEDIGKQTEDIPVGISQPLQLVEITKILNDNRCTDLQISFSQNANAYESYQKNLVNLSFNTDYETLLLILDEFEKLSMTNQVVTMSALYTQDVLTYYTALLEDYYLSVGLTVEFYSFYQGSDAEPISKQPFEDSPIEYKNPFKPTLN